MSWWGSRSWLRRAAFDMKMHNPPHPGQVLGALCLEPLNLTVTDAARSLGVSRSSLSNILNGHAGISPEMAVRLSIAFDTSAELAEPAASVRPLARGKKPETAPCGEIVYSCRSVACSPGSWPSGQPTEAAPGPLRAGCTALLLRQWYRKADDDDSDPG
jgi:addiction module HigA family antidote